MVGVELSDVQSSAPTSPGSSPRSEKSKENDADESVASCESDLSIDQKLSSQWRKRSTADNCQRSDSKTSKRRPLEEEIEQRLRQLTQENNFLKSQLEHRQGESVIVAGPNTVESSSSLNPLLHKSSSLLTVKDMTDDLNNSTSSNDVTTTTTDEPSSLDNTLSSGIIRPTPQSASIDLLNFANDGLNNNSATLQTAGSAFQNPTLNNLYSALNTTPAFQQLASILYPNSFDTSALYGGLFNGMSLNSLANLQAILQQQQQQQQTFSAFASATALTAPLDPSSQPNSTQNFTDLAKEPLNLLTQNPLFPSTTQPLAQNMRFEELFPSSSKTDSKGNEAENSKNLKSEGSDEKFLVNAEADFPVGASQILQRGPRNVQFLNHLPTAHEPRSSVLHHTDVTQSSSNQWPTASKVEPTPINRPLNLDSSSHSLLSSLLAHPRRSPAVPESRTEKQSGLVDRKPEGKCSPHLVLSTNATNKSDSDSLGSPHSTRSTTDSNRSQTSPALQGENGGAGGSSGNEKSDIEKYMDRRRRNNEAAKRCRANRRAVFEYRSRRAQQLESENNDLRQEMMKLNNELEQLKAVIQASQRQLHV
ncbi:unnamed protein product [Bursaphelenchus xylophilus]|uniref:(pine wood nematode) hypothetical protein n=1 Tax=Bursaphelenchus xylophilus TaxID=6326 RepID=A0A811KED8_BURXY|nr:unnamed protein product [Bursaphelenchus xylophilus]CAG9093159.1 unnamed protein product [Bursaphelenchus xylophilus]